MWYTQKPAKRQRKRKQRLRENFSNGTRGTHTAAIWTSSWGFLCSCFGSRQVLSCLAVSFLVTNFYTFSFLSQDTKKIRQISRFCRNPKSFWQEEEEMLCKFISLRHAASSEVTLVPSIWLHPLSFLISCHSLLYSCSFWTPVCVCLLHDLEGSLTFPWFNLRLSRSWAINFLQGSYFLLHTQPTCATGNFFQCVSLHLNIFFISYSNSSCLDNAS